jgi:hypothetical protein
LGSSYQKEGIVPEQAEASIAAITQQSADPTRDVIVVD